MHYSRDHTEICIRLNHHQNHHSLLCIRFYAHARLGFFLRPTPQHCMLYVIGELVRHVVPFVINASTLHLLGYGIWTLPFCTGSVLDGSQKPVSLGRTRATFEWTCAWIESANLETRFPLCVSLAPTYNVEYILHMYISLYIQYIHIWYIEYLSKEPACKECPIWWLICWWGCKDHERHGTRVHPIAHWNHLALSNRNYSFICYEYICVFFCVSRAAYLVCSTYTRVTCGLKLYIDIVQRNGVWCRSTRRRWCTPRFGRQTSQQTSIEKKPDQTLKSGASTL